MIKRVYKAKTLFAGYRINLPSETQYIAVPIGKGFISVVFDGKKMILKDKKPEAIRTFEDKFGRNKQYKLGYYKWQPLKEEQQELPDWSSEGARKFLEKVRPKLNL